MDLGNWIKSKLNPPAVDSASALTGRDEPMFTGFPTHEIFNRPIDETPEGSQVAYFAMGCYWGAEKLFWCTPGVVNTAVGFMGGFTPNPTYVETCTGRTGHTETVRVVFDPSAVSYLRLLQVFFEHHDPTQGNRQGNDIGPQYRSAVFTTSGEQAKLAEEVAARYQINLNLAGRGRITTEFSLAGNFYYAELSHQQYLHKNPSGYDCHVRTGIACPIPESGQ